MKVGRKIFHDNTTGVVLVDTGQYDNAIRYKNIDEEIASYPVLTERNRDSFDVIELEYGQYAQDFQEGRLVGVNLISKTPIFEYPNPDNPSEPIVPEKPLSVQIEEVRLEQARSNTELFETMLVLNGGA